MYFCFCRLERFWLVTELPKISDSARCNISFVNVCKSFSERSLDVRPGLFGAEEVGICNFTSRCCRDFQDQQSVVVISCSLPVRPRFIFRRFISRKLVEMGPNSPPPQPGRFVSCCGHVPSVRLFHPLHDKPWSFANTAELELCATVCAMALPAGVRRQTAAWYFDVFLATQEVLRPQKVHPCEKWS